MARPTKLNKTTQNKIVKLIKTGIPIEDACSYVGIDESTFYGWMKRGQAGEDEFLEFFQSVNRARNAAKVTAIETLHSSLGVTETKRKTVDTFTETRFHADGEPYEYKRTDTHELTILNPGDWRAAVEYLKRRYPDEWSEKRIVELGFSPELLKRLEEVAKLADIPASVLFENMLNALADELQPSGTESPVERTGE